MIILQCYFLHDQVELQGDLQIFGLITLPLVINNVLLGWDKKLQSSKCCWGHCVLVMRAIFRICGNESQSSLQPVQKLATPLSTTKSQFRVKQIRLSSIISNVTNNKHKLWKPVRLTRFRKPQFPIRFNLFSCLFLYLLFSFHLVFMFLAIVSMFCSVCCPLTLFELWQSWRYSSYKLRIVKLVRALPPGLASINIESFLGVSRRIQPCLANTLQIQCK